MTRAALALVQPAADRRHRRADHRRLVDHAARPCARWSCSTTGRLADLYLLTDIDIPWEDDGTRYFPDAADRRRFMAACEQVLDEAGVRFVRICGDIDARMAEAVAAIESLA